MIVTCDKCKAKYKVDDKLAGRKVRCANCGNVWRFELDAFTVTDFDDEPAPNDAGLDTSSVTTADNTNDNAVADQTAASSDTPPPAPADDAPKSQSDVDAMFDTPPVPADDAPKSQSDVDAMFDTPPAAPADDEPKSQSDVDAMFDSFVKQAEVEQLQSETDATENDNTDAPLPENADNGAEVPPSIVDEITARKDDGFTSAEADAAAHKPSAKTSVLKFIAVTVATVIICLTASLWFLRFQLTQEFPQLSGIYETLGIDVLPAGTGLEFKEIVYEKTFEEDTEYLWLKGKIVNISDKTRRIPSIKFVLYDNDHNTLNAATYDELNGKKLPPGKDESFTIWTVNPSKNTVEAEITFTREKSGK